MGLSNLRAVRCSSEDLFQSSLENVRGVTSDERIFRLLFGFEMILFEDLLESRLHGSRFHT